MKKQPKTISISKREYETLLRDQLAYQFLIEAIDQTRAEDELVQILLKAKINL
jgi:hypothetical protein